MHTARMEANTVSHNAYGKQENFDLELGFNNDKNATLEGRPIQNLDEDEFADLVSVVSEAGKKRMRNLR